jgi:hypothetical protein
VNNIRTRLSDAYYSTKDTPPTSALGCMFGGGILIGSFFGFAASFVGIVIGLTVSLYADAYRKKSHRISSKKRLRPLIQEASQYLAHTYLSNYEDWISLKILLDKAEDYYFDREPPTYEELMRRFRFALTCYGPDSYYVRAYFDQYLHRQSFIDLAAMILEKEKEFIKERRK